MRAAWLFSTFIPGILGLASFLQKMSFIRAFGNLLAKFRDAIAKFLEPISIAFATVFLEIIRTVGGWLNELVELYRKVIFDRLYALLPPDFPPLAADIMFVACFSFGFAIRAFIGVSFSSTKTVTEYERRGKRRRNGWLERVILGRPEYETIYERVPVTRVVTINHIPAIFVRALKNFGFVATAMATILLIDFGYDLLLNRLAEL